MEEEEQFFDTVEEEELPQGAELFESVYELHKAAYNNDVRHLKRLLQRMPQDQYIQLDLHGNTALHVAAMRGHTLAVEVLLEAGLPAKTRSSRGWTAFDEACAARAMPVARLLQQRMLLDAKMEMKQKRAQLLDSMQQMPDYSLQLKWQLGSSVPGLGMLLRKYAPHDTYTIWKVGNKLRVDGSLMGISTSSMMPEWKRGHFSLIVDGSPEGIAAAAAAAAAAEQAMAAARQAAKQKSQRHQQQRHNWQQQREDEGVGPVQEPPPEQQQQAAAAGGVAAGAAGSSDGSVSPAPAPVTPGGSSTAEGQHAADPPAGSTAAAAGGRSGAEGAAAAAASSSDGGGGGEAGSSSSGAAGGQQGSGSGGGAQQQQQYFDAEADPCPAAQPSAPSGPGGPRVLFLNHGKGSWVDLSADKKALKLEAEAEEEQELNTELYMAMQRDMEKLRLKPRNFQFAAVKGWLGGDMTEKVEGWKCTVYEATGKLLAVSTSKARLLLSPTATFEDYLAAEYAADAVSETLIDPLTPSGFDMMSSKKDRSTKSSGGSVGAADSSAHSGDALGGDSEFDGMVWGSAEPEPSSSGGSSKKWGKKGSTSSSSKGSSKEAAAAAAEGGGGGSSGGGRVLRARCWMAQSFPMSLAQLLPLLDVIGNANKHMAKVGKFLAKYSQMEMFPVKLQVPLLLTVHALVSFKAFHLLQPGSGEAALAPDFFTVPTSYKRRLLSEVMDKAGKGMMGAYGHDPDADEEEWGLEPGVGGWFYGGDEGAEYMEELAEGGSGNGAADSTSRRSYRIGSGLDEDA